MQRGDVWALRFAPESAVEAWQHDFVARSRTECMAVRTRRFTWVCSEGVQESGPSAGPSVTGEIRSYQECYVALAMHVGRTQGVLAGVLCGDLARQLTP